MACRADPAPSAGSALPTIVPSGEREIKAPAPGAVPGGRTRGPEVGRSPLKRMSGRTRIERRQDEGADNGRLGLLFPVVVS
jgi:hypothetical protein